MRFAIVSTELILRKEHIHMKRIMMEMGMMGMCMCDAK